MPTTKTLPACFLTSHNTQAPLPTNQPTNRPQYKCYYYHQQQHCKCPGLHPPLQSKRKCTYSIDFNPQLSTIAQIKLGSRAVQTLDSAHEAIWGPFNGQSCNHNNSTLCKPILGAATMIEARCCCNVCPYLPDQISKAGVLVWSCCSCTCLHIFIPGDGQLGFRKPHHSQAPCAHC